MKRFFIIIIVCIFCVSCGVKGDPVYKSQNNYIKIINSI